jgi:predicted MFS family arabinose efflux permease
MADVCGAAVDAGPFLLAALVTTLCLGLTVGFLRPDPKEVALAFTEAPAIEAAATGGGLRDLLANRKAMFGIAAMVAGQFVMTLIMVITPLHMSHHAHRTVAISWVIMAHTLGMYGLSNLTGALARRLGNARLVGAGAMVLAASAVLTPLSNEVPSLAAALFLLGLGWNFCCLAGSAILSDAVAPGERGRAQGTGETIVALAACTGSIGTGPVFARAGIVAVSAIGLAVSVMFAGGTRWWRGRMSDRREAAGMSV